jgi:hypothetical protein
VEASENATEIVHFLAGVMGHGRLPMLVSSQCRVPPTDNLEKSTMLETVWIDKDTFEFSAVA